MASRDQDRRNAYAAEHGYDSYDEMRNAVRERREEAEAMGIELDAYEARDQLDWERDIDVENTSYENLRDLFFEQWGEDIDAFHEWLHSYYERN